MQIFYENNVKGVYVEGNYYMDDCDTEFGELRAYMISKCLQDPYCDLESEVKGFCDAYYGPGGKYVKKIVDIFARHSGSFDDEMCIYYGSWACMRPLSQATATLVDTLWKLAERKAETEEQLETSSVRSFRGSGGKRAPGRVSFHSLIRRERMKRKSFTMNSLKAA